MDHSSRGGGPLKLRAMFLGAGLCIATALRAGPHDHGPELPPEVGDTTLSVRSEMPLVAGRSTRMTVQLSWTANGAPISPEGLIEAHTERMHLFLIDPSLTDFRHVHPLPTAVPGNYEFDFTPTAPGTWRVFADILPAATRLNELPSTSITVEGLPRPTTEWFRNDAEMNGVKFHLELARRRPQAGEVTTATLTISHADGTPYTELKPVMGAPAHLAIFPSNRRFVVHAHPTNARPGALDFSLMLPVASYYRAYAQVLLDGVEVYVPFAFQAVGPGTDEATEEMLQWIDTQLLALRQIVGTDRRGRARHHAIGLAHRFEVLIGDATKTARIRSMAESLARQCEANDARGASRLLDEFTLEVNRLLGDRGLTLPKTPALLNERFCAVSGSPVGEVVPGSHIDTPQGRVQLCCPDCAAIYKSSPDEFLAKIRQGKR